MEQCAIVLAAWEDNQMCSAEAKVLLEAAGKPVVTWVKKALDQAGIIDQMYIVGHRQEKVRAELGETVAFALQEVPLGTGHAVNQAELFLYERKGATIVMAGDTPLIRPETITRLLESFSAGNWGALVMTAEVEDPVGYGRILRDETGRLIAIVEESEADAETRAIREVNGGIYCFDTELLNQTIVQIEEHEEGRIPLTDVIEIMSQMGVAVGTLGIDPQEFFKVNTRRDLALASQILNRRILDRVMAGGVSIPDPDTTWIDDDVTIGSDTVILPHTTILNSCVIGRRCKIGPDSTLNFTYVGDDSTVSRTESSQALIDKNCQIGPWVRLRQGVEIGENCVIGSFVEISDSRLGANCQINSQVVINQATLGHGVTVDSQVSLVSGGSRDRMQEEIFVGNHSFIGSHSCLVAPARLDKNSYVATGTTVTRNVPRNALAIGRTELKIKENWALHKNDL